MLHRSAVMAEHMLAREMGLIVGPALNALFGSVNVRLTDTIVLNEYTMPAAFLGTSWVILALLLLIFYAEPSNTGRLQIENHFLVFSKNYRCGPNRRPPDKCRLEND